jgi:mannose-1-phosphate guanylyltransferase/phosphomannomutase
MKAMILAAGFGTRLFPLTIDRTKPAIPFLGKPLVGYVAEYLARFGFGEIAVNLHHRPESIKAALGDGAKFGVKIHYTLEEPAILGTAGALWNARDFLKNETFLTVNGKIITDIDLRAALETHRKSGAIATMVLKENSKREKFTVIETADGCLSGFGGFPAREVEESKNPKVAIQDPPLMYTGIQILEPSVFDYIPPGVESDIVAVFYRRALAEGKKIAVHVADGEWYELSTIERYLDISLAMLRGKNNGVTAGANCRIAGAVRDSVLWNNVNIEQGAVVRRAILADGVTINAGEKIENAAIVRADLVRQAPEIPAKAPQGFFADDNYVVPLVY